MRIIEPPNKCHPELTELVSQESISKISKFTFPEFASTQMQESYATTAPDDRNSNYLNKHDVYMLKIDTEFQLFFFSYARLGYSYLQSCLAIPTYSSRRKMET